VVGGRKPAYVDERWSCDMYTPEEVGTAKGRHQSVASNMTAM
jgi:hypothetical protein